MKPLVSVIIPTYNRAPFLTKTIESVLAQKYAEIELIVIDDGSTDNTPEIIKPYKEKLSYHYQNQRGVSSARNHGTHLAVGKYICFLDSDDLWLPSKISVQVDFMETHPETALCYTDEIWIRNGVRVNSGKRHQKLSGHIFKNCLKLCLISPSSAMMGREFLIKTGGFDEELPACEDYDLWLRICKDYPVEFIEKPLIIKTGGHPDQLSRKYWGNDRFRVKALLKLLENGGLNEEYRNLTVDCLIRKCRILANGSFKRQNIEEGENYLNIIKKYS